MALAPAYYFFHKTHISYPNESWSYAKYWEDQLAISFQALSAEKASRARRQLNDNVETDDDSLIYHITTVFVDTRLSKTKHPRKRFQNFRQSCMLSTDRIEIHQSQPASMT